MESFSSALDSLFDVAQEALASRLEEQQEKVKKFVLPHLALQSKILPSKDEKIPDTIPALPSKLKTNVIKLMDFDLKPTWFYIQSPREVYGAVGPFSVPDLQMMFKYGDINDQTLLWQQGQLDDIGHEVWLPLDKIANLKYKVVNVPEIPQKADYETVLKRRNPIPAAISDDVKQGIRPLQDTGIHQTCARCGGVADCYIPRELISTRETIPELAVLRKAAGSTKAASETIPGYLWIGSVDAAKASVFYQMQFSLAICCGDDIRNPAPKAKFTRPPNYRCRRVQLEEAPANPEDSDESSTEFTERVIHMFDEAHDWIEMERVFSERDAEADLPPPIHRGPTDEFGRPVNKYDNGYPKRPLAERKALGFKILPPSRVLVWSRTGNNRAPAVVAAYLIRRWGISLNATMKILSKARETLTICPAYMKVLTIYESRHQVGELLCADCRQAPSEDVLPIGVGGIVNEENVDKEDGKSGSKSKSMSKSISMDESKEVVRGRTKSLSFDHGNDGDLISRNKESISDFIAKRKSIAEESPRVDEKQLIKRSFSNFDEAIATGIVRSNADLLSKLGHSSTYFFPVHPIPSPTDSAYKLKYHNLIDLRLAGRLLGDDGIVDLFEAFGYGNLIPRVRVLDLQNNRIGDRGAEAIADAFSYADAVKKDRDNYHSNYLEIISMNLADNEIRTAGCAVLGSMLSYCNSLLSFNISNNKAGDEALTALLSPIGVPPAEFEEDDERLDEDQEEVVAVRAERATIVIPKPHNNSLTDLRLTNNDMGEQAAAVISRILTDEDNRTIQSLYLDFNISMRPKDLKNIFKSIYKYNLTLETLSLSDIPITMKNFEGVLKILGHPKPGPPISKLMIARCGINSEYLRNIANIMRMGGQYLRYLDISGNLLGDEGIRLLSEGLIACGAMSKQKRKDLEKDEFDENSSTQSSVPSEGFGFDMSSSLPLQSSSHTREGIQPSSGPPKRVVDLMQQKLASQKSLYTEAILKIELTVKFIPLRYLDVSSCRMGSTGLMHLLSNIKFLSTLRILDLSNNNIGPRPLQAQRGKGGKGHEEDDAASVSSGDTSTRQDDMEEIAEMLKGFTLTELKMNNCRLYTKGTNAIINAMADTSEGCCGATLLVLQLSGNEIYDSFSSTLLTFLHSNATLQVLDLGFNRFTNQFNDRVRGVYQTTSTSRDEFKLNNLTVNLVGNECDRLLLDTPGLSRAKSTNIFRPSQHSSTSSYDHISLHARSGYLARLKFDNETYARRPTAKINFIA